MQKLILSRLIIATITLVASSSALKVDCEFKTSNGWDILGSPYGCFIENLSVTDKQQVTKAGGSHLYGNTNNEVQVFNIYGGTCKILPSGFSSVFKNIQGLTIWKANLKTISKDDLKEFPDLREIWVYHNPELIYLESNLFEYNPKVESINFHSNKIKFVGLSFFDSLPKLKRALFNNNDCINDEAKDSAALETLKKEIYVQCVDKGNNGGNVVIGNNQATLQIIESLQFRVYTLQLQILAYQSTKGCVLV